MTSSGDAPDLDAVDPVDLDASDLLDRPSQRHGTVDDAVLTRATEFERVRARLVDVPPAEPGRRASCLGAALAVFDAEAAAASAAVPASGPGGRAIPFARRRRGRLAPAAALAALAAAAAGFVLVGRGPASEPTTAGGVPANVANAPVAAPQAALPESSGARSDGVPAFAASPAGSKAAPGVSTSLPVVETDVELRAVLGALPATAAPATCPALPGTVRGPVRWAPTDQVVVVVVAGPRARLVTVDDCLEVTTIAVP